MTKLTDQAKKHAEQAYTRARIKHQEEYEAWAKKVKKSKEEASRIKKMWKTY